MAEKTIKTDVLVVGGGGAGFRASIAARERGAKVLLLSKGPLARCGASPMAGADFTLDGNSMNKLGREGDTNDSMERVFNDIVSQGWYLNNQRLVEQYVKTAPVLLKDMMDWGMEIKMSDQRMIFTSGTHIMDVLLKKARSVGVDMLADVALLELVTRDGKVTGGLGLDIRTGGFIHFTAKAVVMATGGWHKGFWPNTGMRDLSGEGIAMSNRAGADIGNMEFITFCCNVFYEPPMWLGSIAPYMVSLICGGRLTNSRGEDILEGYDPYVVKTGTMTEWNKSFISYASMREIRDGRRFKNGGVHYSRGDASWDYMKMVASFVFPDWRYKSIDLSPWAKMLENDEPVEVGPAVEYFEGGIVVNERFETGITGLFAAGECALGAFGANRVFSAITEMLVHGKDAGENAGEYAIDSKAGEADGGLLASLMEKAEQPLLKKKGESPPCLRRHIQEMAHKHLGPIRNEAELKEFIGFLEDVKNSQLKDLATAGKSRTYNKEWLDALELPNIVHLLEAAARSALARKESRGVHFREDYPDTDNDSWLVESIVKLKDDTIEVGNRPATVTKMTPPKGKIPYLDMMKKMMKEHSDTGGKH
ncbi:MAG: FAD-binding protein [Deltaproteobacteria bacterium]|uniref:FAD-binding protein n=1 Tax=Candidatus Zymogenus saltonus TaxID=2844893 RepID=A0A9D8KFB5_9DELT|nr:FAD-binding protein [Candidatus Zymogenus saltonus]